MMTTTVEKLNALKSSEHLEKVFNVLMTPTMYTQIDNHSAHLSISKGALIRSAVQTYLSKVEAE